MKVSLITSTFNSELTIEDTLLSVEQQTYSDLEYIVIDGGSTDATLSIVERYQHLVHHLVSGPDKGIYDALNKGIERSTGDVVGFIHSDDILAHGDVIARVAEGFEHGSVDALYADLDYVEQADPTRVIRKWRSKPFNKKLFHQGWMPAHPTFYLKREHYLHYGGYDTEFKQSADYELMLRMLLKHHLIAKYISEVWVKMRVGGASNASLKNRWVANQEDVRAWKKNGLDTSPLTRWKKPLSKLGQFFKK